MKRVFPYLLCCMMLRLTPVSGQEERDLSDASMQELVVHIQQYGNTVERKRLRSLARDELIKRGTNAFDYLMANYHIDNYAIGMMTSEMVRTHLDDELAAGVLLQYLDCPDDMTRKTAAYYLAFCDTPQYANRLLPLLEDEKAAGAAMRTLGKWAYTNAVAGIVPHLKAEEERRRILAVNALGELRAPETVSNLVDALDDPVFTVRKASRDALAGFDRSVVESLVGALPGAAPVAQRELIDLLLGFGQEDATNALSRLALESPVESVRRDASNACERIVSASDSD